MPITLISTRIAKLVEWNDQKGYGFLQVGKGRVFLHRREFAERHKRPAVAVSTTVPINQQCRSTSRQRTQHSN